MNVDCKCRHCQGACAQKPGWFLPGEAEKAAELLGLSMEEFFRTKLMVDWWEHWPVGKLGNTKNVFVLSPALVGKPPGEEAPANPKGRCVFFKRGLCEIHAAKPHECRTFMHDKTHEESQEVKKQITKAWTAKAPREQIVELLGRKPEAKVWSFFDAIGLMF